MDDLFRLGVFTDLYRVVRQGVRAGVENYSIKRLEPLCGYDRRVDLEEATRSLTRGAEPGHPGSPPCWTPPGPAHAPAR